MTSAVFSVRGGVVHMPDGSWRGRVSIDMRVHKEEFFEKRPEAWEWVRVTMERELR